MKQASASKPATTASKKGAAPTQSTLSFGNSGQLGIKKIQEPPSTIGEDLSESKKRKRDLDGDQA